MKLRLPRTWTPLPAIYSEILHIISGSWAGGVPTTSQDLQVKLKIRVRVWDITCAYLLGVLGHGKSLFTPTFLSPPHCDFIPDEDRGHIIKTLVYG
jgi:hypothetical protein